MSSTTIHEWVAKYTEKLYKYLHKLRPRIGVKWHTDEMYIKIGGETKWLFAITDHVTRFWIVYELGSTKKGHNATRMFVNASKYTKIIPKEISSDSSPVYPFAINAAYQNAITKLIKHKKDNHLQNKYNNNNEQERFNGTLRDREKVCRGLKKSDSPFFKGMWIFYNYFRRHMRLDGDTPAERAGIIIHGKNKWRTLIQNASIDR